MICGECEYYKTCGLVDHLVRSGLTNDVAYHMIACKPMQEVARLRGMLRSALFDLEYSQMGSTGPDAGLIAIGAGIEKIKQALEVDDG